MDLQKVRKQANNISALNDPWKNDVLVNFLKEFPYFRQFSNVYYKHWERGVYKCVVCGIDQFSSKTKYDSGSGWPSFFDVIEKQNIRKRQDASGGEVTFLIAAVSVAMTCNNAQ